jgi:CRP/FNR family transcriptional regulator, dissimilatory nitrate respiration regulator
MTFNEAGDRSPGNNSGAAPSPARRSRHPSIKVQAFLANLPMFSEMNATELDRIASGTVALYAEKGQSVIQCGDPCIGFHVVVYGSVKLGFTSPQGVEKVVEIIRPGQSFGEALMFLDKPYIVFAQALADSMLLHVSKSAVFEELGRDPSFARRMRSGLSRRLHGLVRDVEAYTLRSGAERVIGYLLRDIPDGSEGEVEVTLSPGKSVIASRLNMTPEHFSRILHDLSSNGLIAVEGRVVRVLDVERLRSYSG